MHDVHTFMRFGVPRPTLARTVWMFGFQRRRVRRCECEMLLPKPGPLPHTSQTEATGHSKVEDWRFKIMSAARASHARQGSRQRIPNETPARELSEQESSQNGQAALFCPWPILSCPYDDRA
jgi:hypothetical protein